MQRRVRQFVVGQAARAGRGCGRRVVCMRCESMREGGQRCSRAQALQLRCSRMVACCRCTLIPSKRFSPVSSNTCTATLVIVAYNVARDWMPLSARQLPPSHGFSEIPSNAMTIRVHITKVALRSIKSLCCSKAEVYKALILVTCQTTASEAIHTPHDELAVTAACSSAGSSKLYRAPMRSPTSNAPC